MATRKKSEKGNIWGGKAFIGILVENRLTRIYIQTIEN